MSITSSLPIFIVEDDPVFLKLITYKLKENGYSNLKSFSSGEDCLAALTSTPGLVLLDFSLGGMNGLDVLQKILKRKPKTKVIMLTALDDEELRASCLKHGAYDYIVKNEEKFEPMMTYLLKNLKAVKKLSYRRMLNFMMLVMILIVLIWIVLQKGLFT